MRTAAIVAATLLGVVTVFQIGLALGAPWGAAAWGGRHRETLPVRLRVASGVAGVLLYPLMIYAVVVAGGVAVVDWLPDVGDFTVWIFDVGRPLMWVLAGFFTLGAVANLASKSKVERIWSPVSLAIAVCCVVIALSR